MSPRDALAHAAAHLRCAAAVAEDRAAQDPLNPWWAMAGTIELVAAGLDPIPTAITFGPVDVHQHLQAALAALDDVPADDAPADLTFWRAHVIDLRANARALYSTLAGTSGSDS